MILTHTRRGRRRSLRFAACMGLLGSALLLGACGDDDDDAGTETGTDETSTTASADDGDTPESTEPADDGGGGGATYTIEGLEFAPVSAPAGSTLTIENTSGAPHTVTHHEGAFDVDVPADESATWDIPAEPGEYGFHCNVHSSMTGTLTVE